MRLSDEKLQKLNRLADDGKNTTVYTDNLSFLSIDEIQLCEAEKILLFRGYRDEITCRKCPHQPCTVNPRIVTYPSGDSIGVCNCSRPEEGGRLEFGLQDMKYWDINVEKLPRKRDSKKKDAGKPKISREQQKLNDKTLLISTLLHHHRFDSTNCNTENLIYEPATQKEIAEYLKWKQPHVARIIKRSFPEGFWKRYILTCKSDGLKGFLQKLDDEQTIPEPIDYRPSHPTEREEMVARKYQ